MNESDNDMNELYADFLGKMVDVGIPNYNEIGRLFFFTGVILEISDEYIILKIKDGIRKIPVADIIALSLTRHGGTTK